MVIGMLGGSFCPPTIAHIGLANKCVMDGLCDKVVLVPANDSYGKATNIAAKHRIEMVRLATQDENNVDYSDHEQKHDGVLYTYYSLQMLQEKYPDDKIVLIIGADHLPFNWHRAEELLRDFGLIITNRGGVDVEAAIDDVPHLSSWKDHISIVKYDVGISSTMVRAELAKTRDTEFVKPAVLRYIKEHDLFL